MNVSLDDGSFNTSHIAVHFLQNEVQCFSIYFFLLQQERFEIKKMLHFILPTVFRFVNALAEKLVDLVFLGWSHYYITFLDLV